MCTNPRLIKRPDGSFMTVGCGHCLQCLKAYQDSWTARLSEELKSWSPLEFKGADRIVRKQYPVIFFTLDYNPESVPCRYLVVTDVGVRVQSDRPDCPVERFWTDTTHESKDMWLLRRSNLLKKYMTSVHSIYENCERSASVDDIRNGQYKFVGRFRGRDLYDFDVNDLPFGDYIPKLFRFSESSSLSHPSNLSPVLVDRGFQGTPIIAFEFHSVQKSDVQKWMKRGRQVLTRSFGDVFNSPVNPRFNPFWKSRDGVDHELPSCAIPKNVKFFITSEYGPSTHRPHYHGVMFGVTYDEFKHAFADDWDKNFGHCVFDVLDPFKGGMLYISKYCAKGSYDHPYCTHDIFYPSGEEYHSKDSCPNCVADFGVPFALVDKTFHLISKGIGATYAFSQEVLDYFGAQLTEYLLTSGNLKYVCSDASSVSGFKPSLPLDRLLCLDHGHSLCRSVKVLYSDNGDILIHKFDGNDRLVGESFVSHDSVISQVAENILLNKVYSRSYVKLVKNSSGTCVPVQKISYLPLPRYYRQWLVSPLASCLRQSASVRLYPSLHEKVQNYVQSGGSSDKATSLFVELMASEKVRNSITTERLRMSARSFYSPHGFQRLD